MTRIRKRPVSFGNPALGTYHGNVYTLEQPLPDNNSDYRKTKSRNDTIRQRPLVEGAADVRRLVAMVDVPPEQVPEGILNLARSHRPWIDHVRIVIAENSGTDAEGGEDVGDGSAGGAALIQLQRPSQRQLHAASQQPAQQQLPYSIPPSPGTSAMESAASILAAEHHVVDASTGNTATSTAAAAPGSTTNVAAPTNKVVPERSASFRHQQHEPREGSEDLLGKQSRTYLVLLELSSEEAADLFVEDLHRQPYTSLDETQVCNVHHVIALQGQDGVSLMSPFFAPATQSSVDGGLEILPSTSSAEHQQQAATAAAGTAGDAATVSGAAAVGGAAAIATASTSTSSSAAGGAGSGGSGTGSGTHSSSHRPPLSEDYHCAVCLEHMELGMAPPASTTTTTSTGGGDPTHRTSILTTVCNHSFHMECLLQWQDSPCPVCRYDHSGLNEALSQCHVCGTTEHNYVCLICGAVSCSGTTAAAASTTSSAVALGAVATASTAAAKSTVTLGGAASDTTLAAECQPVESIIADPVASQQRMAGSHAQKHYNETLHAYALDTETQHVWDFCGQGYVHRLLQNKDDGKLVEISDPNNTTSEERSLSPGLTQAQEGEIVHRKLEGFASQYYTLLKSQLEQQRIYYEGRLEEIRREYQGSSNNKTKSCQRKATDLMVALKQEHHQQTHRLTSLKNRCTKVRDDVAFLRHMNESLESNKISLQEQIKQAQKERVEVHQMFQDLLPPLQEKVTRLMLQLESQMGDEGGGGGGGSSSAGVSPSVVENDSKPAAL